MEKLEDLHKQLKELEATKKEPNNIKTKLEAFLQTKNKIISETEKTIEQLETEIKEKTQFLSELKEYYHEINK